jgi:uncharacterized tellurite resistance protein B-like protein
MIDLVKTFFGKSEKSVSENHAEATSHDIHVATCALLLEMSNIDGEFSEVEKKNILSILKKNFQLSDENAAALLEASNEELKNSNDLWRFASLINKNYSIEEKERIIEMIWRVAYADGHLDKHEDYLVHKLAKLLRLSHKQLIEAKLEAKT